MLKALILLTAFEPFCGPRLVIEDSLVNDRGMRVVMSGKPSRANLITVRLWVNVEKGEWALTSHGAKAMCIMEVGDNLEIGGPKA